MNNGKPKARKAVLMGLDGADPKMIKRLMDEGKLPNLKRIMDMGTTTEDLSMIGAQPTITPPNWASLSTGAWPGTHGFTCFWNHTSGNHLLKLDYGFNSRLSKAEFIWDAASRAGKKSIVFNYPTAWPPTDKNNTIYVDGSGITVNMRSLVDYEKIYTCEEGDFPIQEFPHNTDQSGANCMVEGEVEEKTFDVDSEPVATTAPGGTKIKALNESRVDIEQETRADRVLTPIRQCSDWKNDTPGAREVVLPVNNGQQRRFGLILAEDGKKYNKFQLFKSKQDDKPIGEAKAGDWSGWIHDSFNLMGMDLPVAYKIKVLNMEPDGSKMELYYSFALCMSDYKWYYPNEIARELYENVGPMMHMSNSGIKDVMIETHAEMYDWFAKSMIYLMKKKDWDLLYFHVHALDFANHHLQNKILEEHNPDYQANYEALVDYYLISDKLVGDLMQHLDEDTVVFVVSDHGGMSREAGCETPLIGDPWNVGGRLLEEMGYLVVTRENGKAEIDWSKTKAISQRSGYIYVNLKGREPHGSVEPAEYDSLVEKIIDDLYSYRDPNNGRRPVSIALNKRDMKVLGLYGENVGDIYFTFNPSWTRVHGTQLTTAGYKGTSVGCLFMAAGAGIKKGAVLKRPVRIVDIVPTICHLTGIPVPRDCEGGIIYQALEDF